MLQKSNTVPPGDSDSQILKIKILGSDYQGMNLDINNFLWDEDGYNTRLSVGDKVVVKLICSQGRIINASISSYYRAPYLLICLIIFILLFLLIVSIKKFASLLVLFMNIGVVLMVLPVLKTGFNPILATLIFESIAVAVTVGMILGGGKKFFVSFGGACIGLVTAGILTYTFIDLMQLDGFFSKDIRLLLIASKHLKDWNVWDLKGLISSGVMITCFGAIVNISVTISSSCWHISDYVKKISSASILHSGMEVGRDIIAARINTLVLIFIGVSLPMLMVFEVLGIPFLKIINFEFFSILILSVLTSSISLVITVPVSAYLASRFYRKP